jgi:hypothetical protein
VQDVDRAGLAVVVVRARVHGGQWRRPRATVAQSLPKSKR